MMYLRDGTTAAVFVSCLLLFIADNPVKTCTCPEVTEHEQFCSAENLVQLTVLEEIEPESEDDSVSSEFYQYKVQIDKVFKSSKGLTVQAGIDFQTPREAKLCFLHLYTGRQYLLEVDYYNDVLSANACSWIRRTDHAPASVPKLSVDEYRKTCDVKTETMIE
ncbi:hypothetical protein CHS0354_007944 [Potamilus streckersoni]|uniref:NTR domain-containing protein n=1 Tax=Potamilus streckersoni TaxID=2493646 RepID=A0AAE0S9E9_9BIVA|nr:hypothetical protein CHS0354_007944 [Potamilus streckersoni]